MRKDVRIGAIIGGVLIGVLVVYAIVASTGRNKKNVPVTLDGGKASPAGSNSGGAVVSNTPTGGGVPVDRADIGSAPTRDPSTEVPSAAPGRSSATPSGSGTPPATPASGDDTITAIPAADPTAGKNSANWAALLSADHIEGDLQPIRTHTPTPAAAPAKPPVVDIDTPPGDVDPAADPSVAPTQVASASTPGDAGIKATSAAKPADPAPRTATPATGAKTHKVQAGETFSSISRVVYGDAKYFKEIIKANPNANPNNLRLGTVITLPDLAQIKHDAKPTEKDPATPAKHVAPAAPVNPKTEYRVQSTDNLYKISVKLYGNPNKTDAIYQLNKNVIGTDPGKLKLNMVLKLPEPPMKE